MRLLSACAVRFPSCSDGGAASRLSNAGSWVNDTPCESSRSGTTTCIEGGSVEACNIQHSPAWLLPVAPSAPSGPSQSERSELQASKSGSSPQADSSDASETEVPAHKNRLRSVSTQIDTVALPLRCQDIRVLPCHWKHSAYTFIFLHTPSGSNQSSACLPAAASCDRLGWVRTNHVGPLLTVSLLAHSLMQPAGVPMEVGWGFICTSRPPTNAAVQPVKDERAKWGLCSMHVLGSPQNLLTPDLNNYNNN